MWRVGGKNHPTSDSNYTRRKEINGKRDNMQ